jgi:hypothetical protein
MQRHIIFFIIYRWPLPYRPLNYLFFLPENPPYQAFIGLQHESVDYENPCESIIWGLLIMLITVGDESIKLRKEYNKAYTFFLSVTSSFIRFL